MGQKINPYGFRLGISHRPQEPLVRRQALLQLHRRGRQDPQAADQGLGAGRHLLGGDRAHS